MYCIGGIEDGIETQHQYLHIVLLYRTVMLLKRVSIPYVQFVFTRAGF